MIRNDCAIVFECKSTPFKEPSRNSEETLKRLKWTFKNVVQKGYSQGIRVRRRIREGLTAYYDSDKQEKRKKVFDLANISS